MSEVKYEAARLIYVAAPPIILSVLPKGVSIASKATVPTTTKLMEKYYCKQRGKSSNMIGDGKWEIKQGK
jgi:hypothetical protein